VRRLFTDASDRLSPVVVKELRQGVRGNIFTGAFLLLVLLVLITLSLSLLTDPGQSREGFTVAFWFFVAIPLLLILPLGAGVAIAGEVAGNTLEPLLLTRLTAWRVVAGKWSATASQVLVLAVALLPFVLVRYYLGMVEITSDAALLAGFVTCSLLLAGITVSISAARVSALLRSLLVVVAGLATLITFISIVEQMTPHRRSVSLEAMASVGLLVTFTLLSALEVGALQIVPPALFQPARLRVLALLSLGLAAWTGGASASAVRFQGQVVVWSVVLATGVCLGAICEQAPPLPSRYAPFFARRWRKPLRFFLAPGWPGGVGFVTVAALAAAGVTGAYRGRTDALVALGGMLGTAFLPVVVWRTLFPRGRPFLILAVVTFISFSMSTVAAIALDAGPTSLWRPGRLLFPFCPGMYALASLGLLGTHGTAEFGRLPLATDVGFALVTGAVVLATLLLTARAWRGIGRLMAPPPAP
jgi:hypothetical protein